MNGEGGRGEDKDRTIRVRHLDSAEVDSVIRTESLNTILAENVCSNSISRLPWRNRHFGTRQTVNFTDDRSL